MRVVGEGGGWWHSLSHHSKMKTNDWKPERRPNGRSLQTRCAQSWELGAARALSPHVLSLWVPLLTQKNVMTWLRGWGSVSTLKKHQTQRNILPLKVQTVITAIFTSSAHKAQISTQLKSPHDLNYSETLNRQRIVVYNHTTQAHSNCNSHLS